MNSIDEKEALLDRFFREVLVPLAAKNKGNGRSYFPHGPDAGSPSYYHLRERRSMAKPDFEIVAAERPADVGAQLRALWKDDPDLLALVDRLVALMPALAPKTEESGDVSPFIYVMF